MTYLTLEEVRSAYKQIDESITRGTLSEAVVELWIQNAENLINGILSMGFNVPFSSSAVPPLVKTLTYELFEYYWQKAVYTPTSTGDEVPWLYARYDRVMKILYQIASGEIKLIGADGTIIEPERKTNLIVSNFEGQPPIFDMEREVYEDYVPENYGKENMEETE